MAPDAPGRFSTTTGCPSGCARRWATIRAVTSAEPPGENPTMRRIGLTG
jgi:hypothetical protein